MDEIKLKKHIDEYLKLKPLYKDFSLALKFILEKLLDNNNFKYQIVTAREKSEKSLYEKLKHLQSIKRIEKIEDLAGCRIIFYINDDINKFISILRDEFEIGQIEEKYEEDGYHAIHLQIKFKKNRLTLSEYEKYKNLQCNIQLTTVLFHAWSELYHDVIYKADKEISEFAPQAFLTIKNRFSKTMKEHLQEAQHNFDFIFKQLEKIRQGQQIFDVNFLKLLNTASSNNELYEQLKLLSEFVQEFGDKTPKDIQLVEIIEIALKNSRNIKQKPIKNILGEFPGYAYSSVAEIGIGILENLKFIYPDKVFELLCKLSTDNDELVKKKALEALSNIAKYLVLPKKQTKEQRIYYNPQLFLLEKIEQWDNNRLFRFFEAILEIANSLLKTSVEWTSWKDVNTVVLHNGSLPVSKTVKNIRERTLNILKKIYTLIEKIPFKLRVLNVLQEASNTPEYGDYDPKIVLPNIKELLQFYLSIIKNSENEVIKAIEAQAFRLKRRFPSLKKLNELLKKITLNKEYQIFKIFYGSDHNFLEEIDWEKSQNIRLDKIQEFINQISNKNIALWEKRIVSIIANYDTDDISKYYYFQIFINTLGRQKPQIALKLTTDNEQILEPFLMLLTVGIWESDHKKAAIELMNSWIIQNKHIALCASILNGVKEIDKKLLIKIYENAKQNKNIEALTSVINAIINNCKPKITIKTILLDCIIELGHSGNYDWIIRVYKDKPFWTVLTIGDWRKILENLVNISKIDFDFEEVLAIAAIKSPKIVINFLHKRIKAKIENRMQEPYNEMPFQFYFLIQPLRDFEKIAIKEILKWSDEKNSLFYWHAGHLLQNIFPNFTSELEKELIKLLDYENKAKFILLILHCYQGEPFIHKICQEFIKQYSNNDNYMTEMFVTLSRTGIVTGEFGLAEAYERKKQEIQSWKTNTDKRIMVFVKQYEKYLDKQIIHNRIRAIKENAINKREFEEST